MTNVGIASIERTRERGRFQRKYAAPAVVAPVLGAAVLVVAPLVVGVVALAAAHREAVVREVGGDVLHLGIVLRGSLCSRKTSECSI